MAFPTPPFVNGQQHTEEGILYQWSTADNGWNLVIETSQELIESTVNPTPADVQPRGSVWRNTTTGDSWEYSENLSTGLGEWVKIVSDNNVLLSPTAPNEQLDGTSIQPGDIWIDTSVPGKEVAWYSTSAGVWEPIKISFDNTIANLTGTPQNTQEAIDILANRISVLTKGLSFYGTYDASLDAADFTTASGLTDGPLPAAGPTNQDTYLVVNTDGTPGSGPLSGTPMSSGDWVISDGTSWTHLDLTTSVSTFLGHPDTPTSYTGQAGNLVRVNATETALEFVTISDTHSIFASGTTYPGGPAFRDPPTNTVALQPGDRWIDSDTLIPYTWSGAAPWKPVVPVIVSTTSPAQTTDGLLWYNPSISTLFVRDAAANAWAGI